HLFDQAMVSGDRASAEEQFALLQGDRWLAQYGLSLGLVPALEARILLLRGNWQQPGRRYEDLLAVELTRAEGPSSEESLARKFFEYGQALAGADRPDDARAVWEYGLRCPDHAGNWFWKQQIAQLLNQTDA